MSTTTAQAEVRAGQELKKKQGQRERRSWRTAKRRSAQLIEMQGTCRLQLHLSNHHFPALTSTTLLCMSSCPPFNGTLTHVLYNHTHQSSMCLGFTAVDVVTVMVFQRTALEPTAGSAVWFARPVSSLIRCTPSSLTRHFPPLTHQYRTSVPK